MRARRACAAWERGVASSHVPFLSRTRAPGPLECRQVIPSKGSQEPSAALLVETERPGGQVDDYHVIRCDKHLPHRFVTDDERLAARDELQLRLDAHQVAQSFSEGP